MRSFSRSVMRHYAAGLPEIPTVAEPQGPPPPVWTAPPIATETPPQAVTSAPLPFDSAVIPPVSAPLLPPTDTTFSAVTPPSVQRDPQPAAPPPIATGPDGKPLMYKGQPIPVSDEPTPPALRELLRRDRERAATVQRLTEERVPQLKADLPVSDDPDLPHSSRLRRRGSADVDYIQTKALNDHREPGDTASKVPPKTPKAGRESEQKPAASPDDDDDANEGDGASFPESLVGSPAADSLQRGADGPPPSDSLPFAFQNDVQSPAENPAVLPVLQRQPEPDRTSFVPDFSPAPEPASFEIQNPPSAQPVQRQAAEPPAPPATSTPSQPHIQREAAPDNVPPAVAQPDSPLQRQDIPAVPPAQPQVASAVQRTESEAPSSGLPPVSHPATAAPVVQRESAAPALEPSEIIPPLPFDPAYTAPQAAQSQAPAAQRQADAPDKTFVPAPTASGADVTPASAVPTVQRAAEPASETRPAAPAPQPASPDAATPAASAIDAPPASAAPAVQRTAEPTSEIGPAVQQAQPEKGREVGDPAPAAAVPAPLIQRRADPAPEMADVVPPVLLFDQPAPESPAVPASTSPVVQRDMPEPELLPLAETQRPAADAILPVTAPVNAPLQRQPDVQPEPASDTPVPSVTTNVQRQTDPASPSRSVTLTAPETPLVPEVERQPDPASAPAGAPSAPQVVQRETTPSGVEPLAAPEMADVVPPVLPFDPPASDAQLPVPAGPPQGQLQRMPDLSGQPSEPAPRPSITSQETGRPALQRQLETRTPDTALPARDLSAPSATPMAAPPLADVPSLTSPDSTSPASLVQRQPQVDPVDASQGADGIPPVLPFDQPAPEAAQPSRAAQPEKAPTVQRQPETTHQSRPAASPQQDAPAALPTPSPSVPDAVQRTLAPASPDLSPTSGLPDTAQSAPSDAPSIQRTTETTAPAPSLPASRTGPESAMPQPVPSQEVSSAPPIAQREPEWAAPAVDAKPAPLPFDAPAPVRQSPPSDSTVPSPVPPAPSSDMPLPALNRQVDRSTQPGEIGSDVAAQDAITQVQVSAPAAQPAVQRQHESAQPAPEMADITPPLPFDTPSIGQPSPAIQRQPETAAESPVSSPAEPIAAQIPPAVQSALVEPMQRQPADPASPEPAAPEVHSLPVNVTPPTIPFDPLPSVPSQSPPAVQRQAEATDAQPSVSQIPFDDLQTMSSRTSRVQRQVQAAEPPPVLPFDPLPSATADALQRETDESMSDAAPLSAGNAAQKMDVFQALVAAGMVPRPGSMPALPSSQSTVQRSPSRDAYLEQFAARESGRDVQSISEPAPVQRAVNVEEMTTTISEPSQSQSQSSALDVDKLAADVMKVLRGKLRSEAERNSKR